MSPQLRQKGVVCIVEYSPEEYTRFYIVQALFKLMAVYEYGKISITDIAAKAGVGRATFYRYFKSKEDVLIYYFEHEKRGFVFSQRLYPRCKEDYVAIAESVFTKLKEHKEQFKLIRKARLEYIYLDYLNKNFIETFDNGHSGTNLYAPYIYAGMLFNISMAWLDGDCKEPVDAIARTVIDAVYFE